MSRKLQILQLLEVQPMSTRAIAHKIGVKVSTATVHVASLRALGLVHPVSSEPRERPGQRLRDAHVWGPV